MARTIPYIFCGDDFTGSSDTLATLARQGLSCRLFLSPEALLTEDNLGDLDAVGIATANRALPPDEIAHVLQQFVPLFERNQPTVFHYKVCSTFDSSPTIGSIGSAVSALKQLLPESPVLIVGGQPSLKRYCVFSNLFAAGPDSIAHRIDRHPTMANHPVTPMGEADLRRLLAAQGLPVEGYIHFPSYHEDIRVIGCEVNTYWRQGTPVLFDVKNNQNLQIIGLFLHEQRNVPIIAVGSSSVAEAYLSRYLTQNKTMTTRPSTMPVKPVCVIAGSRSQMTASQVEHSSDYQRLDIQPEEIERGGRDYLENIAESALRSIRSGRNLLAVVGSSMSHNLARAEVAAFTARLATKIAFSGEIGRLCIAGGDTSSLALQQLKVDSLSFLADIEPGLCLCQLHAQEGAIDGLEIVLKGGQMGSPQLFNKLLREL